MTRWVALALLIAACARPPARARPAGRALSRADFNRFAVRANLPIFWIADANGNGRVDPDEVAALLFYPTDGRWVANGALTPAFTVASNEIVAALRETAPDGDLVPDPPGDPDGRARRALVGADLDAGLPALVRTDLHGEATQLVDHLIAAARWIDRLYERQNGAAALADRVGRDLESRSLVRRNHGPSCVAPSDRNAPLCSAVPGSPTPLVDAYPAELQRAASFCAELETHPAWLDPFTVVRGGAAVPYTVAYRDDMTAIAAELRAAADAVRDPAEAALVAYLRAAAASFESNDWHAADAAWAKMSAASSAWYVRVGPDDAAWEPCAHKAGFHLTLARIDPRSSDWGSKLVPVQQELEASVAALAGAPYAARTVTLHLPDLVDVVVAAGTDRAPLGATLLQRRPERTVAIVNLFTDPDSVSWRRDMAAALFDTASMKTRADSAEPDRLLTTLRAAARDLGPDRAYTVNGAAPDAIFGAPTASVLEELKAQAGALDLIEQLRTRAIVSDELARQSYIDAIEQTLAAIEDMYDAADNRKPGGNAAAIALGVLVDQGALSWDAKVESASGNPGAFTLHPDRLVTACHELMKATVGILARGDRAAADALLARYADERVVPYGTIAYRFRIAPTPSFVYSVMP